MNPIEKTIIRIRERLINKNGDIILIDFIFLPVVFIILLVYFTLTHPIITLNKR